MEKPGDTGFTRIIKATGYSMAGLAWAWRKEAGFRLEVILALLLAPLAWHLGETGGERALLFGALLLVLMMELVNTAIEAVVDRFGGELHPLSKAAKDVGSAVVFVSLVNVVLVWALVLLT